MQEFALILTIDQKSTAFDSITLRFIRLFELSPFKKERDLPVYSLTSPSQSFWLINTAGSEIMLFFLKV